MLQQSVTTMNGTHYHPPVFGKTTSRQAELSFDLLAPRESECSDHFTKVKALIEELRLLAQTTIEASYLIEPSIPKAAKILASRGPSISDLIEIGGSMRGMAFNSAYGIADAVKRRAAFLGYVATVLLTVQAVPKDSREAYRRLAYVAAHARALPEKALTKAARHLSGDVRNLMFDRLPRPAHTSDCVEYEMRFVVPDYCVGERFKHGDAVLTGEENAEVPKVGRGYVFGRGANEGCGYCGNPPDWMVGKFLGSSPTHWRLKNEGPKQYVWNLPKSAWGRYWRIVGHQLGEEFLPIN
jgi:hypothetical protein